MKFTLKDYQSEGVRDVLERLRKARKDWHQDAYKSSFSLTATTGAGKTVMAAAVFEALFYSDEEYDVEPDRGAVVIWFSDDPSLNEQSKSRLIEASDRLNGSQLKNVDNSFSQEKFGPGMIYFLNTQKLAKNALLVRGGDPVRMPGMEAEQQFLPMPDMRAHTIWDTIQNTIDDPDLTLYLVLDEAHRGMRDGGTAATTGRQTIIKQLINGKGWETFIRSRRDKVGAVTAKWVERANKQNTKPLKSVDVDGLDSGREQGRVAGGRRTIEASDVVRGDDSVDAPTGRHKYGEDKAPYEREIKRQEDALEADVKEEGIWMDPGDFLQPLTVPALVYQHGREVVIKLINLGPSQNARNFAIKPCSSIAVSRRPLVAIQRRYRFVGLPL